MSQPGTPPTSPSDASGAPGAPGDSEIPARIELDRLVGGAHHNPHALLGAHELPDKSADGQRRTVVRTLRPGAAEVVLIATGLRVPMTKIHDGGVFQAVIDEVDFDYRLAVSLPVDAVFPGFETDSEDADPLAPDADQSDPATRTSIVDDPYRWLPTVGELDLHLFGEGRHERLWEIQGAHVRSYDTPSGAVVGTSFAVWAPNAQGARVAGDFSGWSGRALPMRSLGSSGLWEIFVPGVESGALYKFQLLGQDGVWREKADPLAFAAEKPPATASKVFTSDYSWSDDDWLRRRAETQWHRAPMSIYEVHLGSWRPNLSYRDLAEQLVDYVVDTGFTHVEFLPVAEHPFGGSWGYQVSSYYAPTARFGTPDEFRHLVDSLHRAGIGVIVDWVPAHFPKDAWSLGRFDGTALYEHPDPRRGEQPDWGTYVFDFGRREVRNFLVANALFWLAEFHIDGLRVDAVASMLYLDYSRPDGQWLPNQYGGRENLDAVSFLQEVNATVYREHPGAMIIAEESTAWPGVTRPTHLGGLGFGFKWNMGWMHDTLSYLENQPIHRQYHHHQMTFSMMYAYSENFVLPISHDEVVHGKGSLLRKMPGDRWQQLANVRAMLAYMWAHPGKQLLFMGSEFAQDAEWAESHSLDWWLLDNPDHAGVQALVRDLNKTYVDTPALWERDTAPEGFSWIDANDAAGNVLSFLRYADGSTLACVANFAGVPHENYQLGLPYPGTWEEIVNTDATSYCGSGVGNLGLITATETPRHGLPASAAVRLPPLGTVWLRHRTTT